MRKNMEGSFIRGSTGGERRRLTGGPSSRKPGMAWSLLFAAAVLSCESPVELVVEEAEWIAPAESSALTAARLGGFLVRASAWSGRNDDGAHVVVTASARNTTAGSVSTDAICVAQLRVRDLASSRLLWTNSAAPMASCVPRKSPLPDILSGREFEFSGPIWALTRVILGGGLREGEYAVGVLVRAGADTVEVSAGRVQLSLDLRPPLRDPRLLRYRTSTTVEGSAPRMVVTRVVATNPTDRWVEFSSGACFMHVRAFRDASRTGPPAWRTDSRPLVCSAILYGYSVAPGATLGPDGFTYPTALADILGDSLPDGRYWFSTRLDFVRDAPEGGLVDLGIEIPAGSAELVRSPDPLPSERLAGGVRYRVDNLGATGAGETLLRLVATNVGTQPVLLVGALAGCTVQISGYVDATREGWYRAPPDWTATTCGLRFDPTWLDPGETRTFQVSVAPDPRAPAGPLTLTLRLFVEQDPGTHYQLLLAAGTAAPGG
jgi:hypothetical protein